MKKNQLARKTMTGGVACALLLGSFVGGGFGTKAFAQTASVSSAAAYSPVVAQHLNSIVRDTAWLADKDAAVINEALQKGQTLAEASGLSASDLTDKLTGLLNEDINHLYEDSDASSSEINALKAQGASAIASAVSEKGYQPAAPAAVVDLNAVIQNQLNNLVIIVSSYADKDLYDIEESLKGGATLITVSGFSQSDLISKLTTQLNQVIDTAALNQHIAPSVIQAAKANGAIKLAEAISTEGYEASNQLTVVDVSSAVYGRLNNVITDVANIADKDYVDITDALHGGATLIQASGISENNLYNSLVWLMDNEIDKKAVQGSISQEKLNQVKIEAHDQIQKIITTPGYTVSKSNENLTVKVQEQLNQTVAQAAVLADKELYEIEDALEQGSSLAAATGLNSSELTQKLLASINQFIDANSTNVDADTVSKAKQDAASYISRLVQVGTAE